MTAYWLAAAKTCPHRGPLQRVASPCGTPLMDIWRTRYVTRPLHMQRADYAMERRRRVASHSRWTRQHVARRMCMSRTHQRWKSAFLAHVSCISPWPQPHATWANCRFSAASKFAMTSVLWRTSRGEACMPILQTVTVCASMPNRGLEQAGFTPCVGCLQQARRVMALSLGLQGKFALLGLELEPTARQGRVRVKVVRVQGRLRN
ncbi:hypothetical protein HBI20_235590 [Parastagonospora nodorum]|nr:hypothetical protein HBI76_078880 [Parastagonospora nodorum]KAH5705258.1 hypothetical protein HBI20_235590 [Parastagonospora nodorum]